jgi:hypothetical protein
MTVDQEASIAVARQNLRGNQPGDPNPGTESGAAGEGEVIEEMDTVFWDDVWDSACIPAIGLSPVHGDGVRGSCQKSMW